ncbi:MAG: alpha/beta hydrolase [Deltaproteobacteria bacterium]|nr:alpha/beta hydrolase [Deltaproteobacteria bacterium]
MAPALHVVSAGVGPRVLLIHGSATDAGTWSIQLAPRSPLREQLTLVSYTRRSTGSVEDHAVDAIELIGDSPSLVVGSSFGAVVALEVLRRGVPAVRGAVLIEPPMAPSDDAPAAPIAFLSEFDRRVAEQGGPAAAEFFLRTVLGDVAYDRIPEAFQERSKQRWAEIRADSEALIAYRPRYPELPAISTPVLLLGGDRSASYFRPTLEALRDALPNARLELIHGAGHMLHAEAHREFARHVTAFAADCGLALG